MANKSKKIQSEISAGELLDKRLPRWKVFYLFKYEII